MTAPKNPSRASAIAATLAFAEAFVAESDGAEAARRRAEDLGVECVSTGVAAALTLLAKVVNARAVAEIGTGTGVSALALLAGMAPDGVLTSIDAEAEHQLAAREVLTAEGVPSRRVRLIAGQALSVLPKLTDGAYDLVFIDGEPADQPQFVAEGVRLLRSGGVIVVHRAALGGRAGDAAANDRDVTAVREATRAIAEDERLTPVLVPLGDGLLAAVRD